MEARIIDISRHRMGVDGKGVTTLVALSGCPLRCRYCLNPQCLDERRGRKMSTNALHEEVRKDHLYFLATGGGVTFGGGEPLLHSYFIQEFKEVCHPDWKVNIETSLNVPIEIVNSLAPIVDQWIIDIKDTNPLIYRAYTKKSNISALQNLKFLLSAGANITVRVPHIPNFNTTENVAQSIRMLRDWGVNNIDEFTYIIREK
ncbi:MAG: radical SAM protein [Muribaculaceae bacterium]|nr:radical SAM protein [Muribaculaceae bacterium]